VGRPSFSVAGLLGRPVSGSGSGAFASCAGSLGVLSALGVPRTTQAASPVFG